MIILSKLKDNNRLRCKVTGMQLNLFNDSWKIPRKTVLSFETYPVIGSHFYIGCEELFQKSTKTVSLNMGWQQVPEIFKTIIKNITDGTMKIREAIALVSENSTVAGEKAPIITSGTTGRDLVDGSESNQNYGSIIQMNRVIRLLILIGIWNRC